jgi:hypothetical protein
VCWRDGLAALGDVWGGEASAEILTLLIYGGALRGCDRLGDHLIKLVAGLLVELKLCGLCEDEADAGAALCPIMDKASEALKRLKCELKRLMPSGGAVALLCVGGLVVNVNEDHRALKLCPELALDCLRGCGAAGSDEGPAAGVEWVEPHFRIELCVIGAEGLAGGGDPVSV